MLKYTDTKVCFQEVPDEISLAISISGCPNSCRGCHSPHLHEDVGTILDCSTLDRLVADNSGITCVCFLGGDADPKTIDKLAKHVKECGLKVCWYSGNDSISSYIDARNFDYIKIGHYDETKGPLTNPHTNQKMFKVITYQGDMGEYIELYNITNVFFKHE